LAEAGPEALRAIRAFLERLEDIEYEGEGKDLLRAWLEFLDRQGRETPPKKP
jgi:hypothetical protein